jgi:multidrug transporter EmrE-like cation transporter
MSLAQFLMLLLAAIFTAISNLSLRVGVQRLGGFELSATRLLPQLLAFSMNPACMVGLVMQGLAAMVWFRILSIMEVSRGYPVMVSLTFLLVILGSLCFFGETMSWIKFAGLAVILAGVHMVARG